MADIWDNAAFLTTPSTSDPNWPELMPSRNVNDAARHFQGAMARYWEYSNYKATAFGSSNYLVAFSVAPTVPIADGMVFRLKIQNSNTATTCTLDIGNGAKQIIIQDSFGTRSPIIGEIEVGYGDFIYSASGDRFSYVGNNSFASIKTRVAVAFRSDALQAAETGAYNRSTTSYVMSTPAPTTHLVGHSVSLVLDGATNLDGTITAVGPSSFTVTGPNSGPTSGVWSYRKCTIYNSFNVHSVFASVATPGLYSLNYTIQAPSTTGHFFTGSVVDNPPNSDIKVMNEYVAVATTTGIRFQIVSSVSGGDPTIVRATAKVEW